mgnify:CR=1 FL=1
MTVGLVGSGPAVDAVGAALADVDAETTVVDPDAVATVTLAVAVGRVGDDVLATVDEHARESALPWIAVELGGVGGYPVVDAAVAGFAPETACYQCLCGRVAANVDPEAEPTAAPPAHTARFAGAVAGRAAARHLAGEESAVFGTLREIPHAERPLLPLPGCSCGDDYVPSLDLTAVDRTLEESLALAERGLDERVGVVQEVGEAESVPAPYYLAQTCDTTGFSDATAARNGAGVSPDWDAAFMKALGEGYERYCAGVYRTADLREGPPAEVADAVPPADFVRPEDGDEASIRWVEGRDLHADATVSLPAELVHYPPATERLRPAITTGLGLGNGGVEATLSGLYEVIERDAAMLSWYSTFDPIELDVEDEGYRTLARRARVADLSVSALLLTQDVDVPVVAAVVHREEWPRFAVGSGANLDAGAAARGALAEALQNWMELRSMGREAAPDASGEIGHYADAPDDANRFLSVDTVASASTVGPTDVPAGEAELAEVLDRVAAADLTAYAAPTTTRDVAALGFEAVRVVVPAAQPLFFGDPYFGDRAETVPVELGFEPAPDRRHHPFP